LRARSVARSLGSESLLVFVSVRLKAAQRRWGSSSRVLGESLFQTKTKTKQKSRRRHHIERCGMGCMPAQRNERESERARTAGARGRDWDGGARSEKCRAERVRSEMCEIERACKRMRKSWVSAPDVGGVLSLAVRVRRARNARRGSRVSIERS
jgi:hypothetical protein